MEKNKKMVYVPPTVEVIQVVLEGCIAQSVMKTIVLEDWIDETYNPSIDNADIVLPF